MSGTAGVATRMRAPIARVVAHVGEVVAAQAGRESERQDGLVAIGSEIGALLTVGVDAERGAATGPARSGSLLAVHAGPSARTRCVASERRSKNLARLPTCLAPGIRVVCGAIWTASVGIGVLGVLTTSVESGQVVLRGEQHRGRIVLMRDHAPVVDEELDPPRAVTRDANSGLRVGTRVAVVVLPQDEAVGCVDAVSMVIHGART